MSNTDNNRNNHLADESSPYLQQHAQNPVDWYPWNNEAFEAAIKENKPIFLSIGYSTCHWCHVMAHESFEDNDIAEILNKYYISIKVDREERPDIDEIYMSACQAFTGSGGWPLTILMTAEKEPFFAGTYLPKNSNNRFMGLSELLLKAADIWQTNKKSLIDNAVEILKHLKNSENLNISKASYDEIIDKGYQQLTKSFDCINGGFSTQPKFPTPHYLLFLLMHYSAYDDKKALDMVEKTLIKMYSGGIFDHIGYGFSRYSTDSRWLIPHFEKMLYDNALLTMAYTQTYSITKNPIYKNIAIKIITYLFRDMLSETGGFYSAEDADSEGVEGKFYVWSYDELESCLSEDELNKMVKYCGISKKGNFEGKNIINFIDNNMSDIDLQPIFNKLYSIRSKRIHPFKDTKISSGWNSLLIAALSRAGVVFKNDSYINAAEKAAAFILNNMVDTDINLSTIYKDEKLSKNGFLSDYANLVWALIELYKSKNDISYLTKAISISDKMIEKFWSAEEKQFFMSSHNSESLPLRPVDNIDSALPSGTSMAVMNLYTLYNITDNMKYKETADIVLYNLSNKTAVSPMAYIHQLSAMLYMIQPHRQIILTGKNNNKNINKLYNNIQSEHLPFTTVISNTEDSNFDKINPHMKNYKADNDFRAYICRDFSCKAPIDDIDKVYDKLDIKKQ